MAAVAALAAAVAVALAVAALAAIITIITEALASARILDRCFSVGAIIMEAAVALAAFWVF